MLEEVIIMKVWWENVKGGEEKGESCINKKISRINVNQKKVKKGKVKRKRMQRKRGKLYVLGQVMNPRGGLQD